MTAAPSGMFRSLRGYNFRVWSAGALISNVGAWMQRIAQDWLVLTVLTHRDARAVGLVTALQFAPQVLLLPWTGWAADHLDRRRLLFATQSVMGALALGLGSLTISGLVRAWQVDVFAFLLGCASAFDQPARQTFVGDMVGEDDLSNAIGLNSTSFNASRLIGPAVAGLLIAAVGSGWVFILNGVSFAAVLASLIAMRGGDLHPRDRPERTRGGFLDGLRYVRGRPDLQLLLLMLLVFGALGLNFAIFISTKAASVLHAGAGGFGLLTSVMAVGSVAGALLAARRERPGLQLIVFGALVFGCAYAVAAVAPDFAVFGLALAVVGAASQTVSTSTISLVQLSTEPAMRGRVTALLLTVALGGLPLGAPFVGWVAHTFGPRWAVGVGAFAGFSTAAIGAGHLIRCRRREASTLS